MERPFASGRPKTVQLFATSTRKGGKRSQPRQKRGQADPTPSSAGKSNTWLQTAVQKRGRICITGWIFYEGKRTSDHYRSEAVEGGLPVLHAGGGGGESGGNLRRRSRSLTNLV